MALYELGFDELPAKYLISLSKKKGKIQRKLFGYNSQVFLTPRRIIIKTPEKIEKEKIIEFLKENYSTMRWIENSKTEFVRPLRWILAIEKDKKIDIEIFGVPSSNFTFSHRALGNKKIEIQSEDEFFLKLKEEGKVFISDNERREKIKKILQENGIDIKKQEELIEIATFSTEHPYPIVGKINSERIPYKIAYDILTKTLFVFPISKDEKVIEGFLAIADNPHPDEQKVKEGYEFVIRSRFEDAEFYINEDRKMRLSERIHLLEKIVFNERFGSFYDREVFVAKAADFIYAKTGIGSRDKIKRAVMLSKADITTGLFREFPEHQGYIGMFYAIQDGEDEEIAKAIFEHTLPEKPNDPLPESELGTIISIADKLIHIFSAFLSSLHITGEEDPFGLRRAARAVIRTLIEKKLDIDIAELSEFLEPFFIEHMTSKSMSEDETKEKISHAITFIKERIENYLSQDIGLKKDIVKGVVERTLSPSDAFARAKALSETDFSSLFYVARRVRNIIEQAQKKGLFNVREIDKVSPRTEAEAKLLQSVLSLYEKSYDIIKQKNYKEFISLFDELREPVDNFFNSVMVLSENEEEREIRLSIIFPIFQITDFFADFTKIEKR
ncbi:Glycine--tRNA ligase beta subunit [bacterium HR19]|nr:Glycine--tRNA ligase beta subunit [bacterium HR19]